MRSEGPQSQIDARNLTVAVAVSRYHESITTALCDGAQQAFERAGGDRDRLHIIDVPGAFELPVVCAALLAREDIDAVVALGCVIRGETTHDQHINDAVASSLVNLAVSHTKPVAFGLLTCGTTEQATARAGGVHGNKGVDAMEAAIATSMTLTEIARTASVQGASS